MAERNQPEHKHEGVLPHGDTEHGEGNKDADRHYREGVQRTVKDKDVQRLAREAKDALDSEEGKELRDAEKKGKSRIAEEDPEVYAKRMQERGAGKR